MVGVGGVDGEEPRGAGEEGGEAAEEGGAEIIDLAELLRRSLGKPPPKRPARGEGKPSSPRSPRRAGGKAA